MSDDSHSDGQGEHGFLRVLLIEDNPGDARLFEEYLRESDTEVAVRHEQRLDAGLHALRDDPPDILVLDLDLPDSQGADTVTAAETAAPTVPIVVLTGQTNMDVALRAQEAGATEYLQKDELTPALVGRTLRWAARQNRMQSELQQREAWIRSLSENVSAGMFRAGPTGRIEHANDAFVEMLGYAREEEVLGQDLTTLSANPTQQGRMLAEEGADETEITLRRKDESVLVGQLSAEATYGPDGEILHYDGVITDITEQKRTLQRLEESEALTRSVLDALAANVAVLDAEGTIIDVNEHWTRFGRENDAGPALIAIGANYLEACRSVGNNESSMIPDVSERLRSVIEGECDLFEWEYPCHGPEENRWFLLRATPLDRETGGAVVAHLDITDRVEAVREQRVLSEAVEQAKEAILITEGAPLDAPGPRIQYVNSAFEEMTGYSEADILGETPRILQGPETEREVLDDLRDALEAGTEWQGETINYRKDGTPYVVQWNVAPVIGEDGEIEYWVSVQRDVTDQREREAALRQHKQLLEQTQRLAGAWAADLEANQSSGTDKVAEILGLPPEADLDIEETFSFFDPEYRPRLRKAFRRCAEEGTPYDLELPLTTADGHRRWVRTVGAAIENQDGQITKVAGALQDITERKEAEQDLRDSRERYRSLFADASDAILIHDLEGRVQEVNPQAEALFGYDTDDLVGRSVFDVHPSDEQEVAERKLATLREDQAFRAVACYERADGSLFWGEVSANVTDVGGETVARSMIRDVTDRIEVERTLREERDLLDRIFEMSPVSIVLFDMEGNFVRASDRTVDVLGLDKEGVTQRTFNDPDWDITTPDGEPIPDDQLPFAQVIATGEPVYDLEHTIVWPKGSRRLLSVSGAPLHTHSGEVEGAVFHIEDITERRRIEERFRGVFENAGLGIALLNESGTILEANPALESMLGYEPGALRDFHFDYITLPDDVDEDKQLFNELVAGEREQYQMEKRYLRRDGEVFWGHLTVSRREVPGGVQVVGMVQNIDGRKQRKEQLRAAKEEAERMNRLKSAFLANMSHEIRTPLTSILGFAEAIGKEVGSTTSIEDIDLSALNQFSGLIQRSGHRLMETLNGVLNLSKLQAGEMKLTMGPVDVVEEAADTVEEFGPQAEESGIDLHLDAPDGPVWGRADEGGLRIVLRNLLSNAIKYTESGGDVWVRVRRGEMTAVLEVEDTGIGMDPERASELFQAFKQESEGMSREYEGAGLGLTVTRELLSEMHGSIEVETQKGGGSRFTVRLPQGTVDPVPESTAEEQVAS